MNLSETAAGSELNLDVLLSVPVSLSVEVGRTSMTIGDLLETTEGSVVQLSRAIDAPLDIFVNDSPVAKGIVVMQDDSFGIQITEIVSPNDRARKLQLADAGPAASAAAASSSEPELSADSGTTAEESPSETPDSGTADDDAG